MCPRRSHTLAPLTVIMSYERKFKWTKIKQDAFDKIKWIVARDNLLIYPDFNKAFKMYTDASAFQLGAFISQKVKPISLYSIKLTDYHQMYTVTEN